jgi:REP element-mobilizing transposase RayT
MWNLPAPPGFQGLIPDKPLTVYVRHLPHWRQEGATYFVTFRLADSLPRSKLEELRDLKQEWERKNPLPRSESALEDLARRSAERIERWLDQGMGECVLKDPSLAAHVVSTLHHFDDVRYELGCYVVMPNHVHAVVRTLSPGYPLEDIIGSWKKFSARRINQALRQSGELWQDECYDRIVRDEEHLWRIIQYFGSNPERAGVRCAACPLWIRPQWINLGWKIEKPLQGERTAQESPPTVLRCNPRLV